MYNFLENDISNQNWNEQNGIMHITNNGSFCEPNIVAEDDSNSISLKQLETEFNNMIESVEKYGGFYIGRYETGNLSQLEAVITKNNTDISNQTWYTIYEKSKGIAANANVTSTMIWGSQWDATLRYLYNSGDIEKKKFTYDSTGKGNYQGEQGETYKIIPTGSDDKYKINNIYDMAGNVGDWTLETHNANEISYRVVRGYYLFDANGLNSPVSARNYEPATNKLETLGSRVALYINI